jgi:hypothetical protein
MESFLDVSIFGSGFRPVRSCVRWGGGYRSTRKRGTTMLRLGLCFGSWEARRVLLPLNNHIVNFFNTFHEAIVVKLALSMWQAIRM